MSTALFPSVPACFRKPWLYLALLLAGYGAAFLVSGLLRHLGKPGEFPLLGDGAERTWRVDPWRNPYEALFHWNAVYEGDFVPVLEAVQGRRADPDYRIYQPEQLSAGRSSFVYTPIVALVHWPLTVADVPVGSERWPAVLARAANWESYFNHILWLGVGVLLALIISHGLKRRPSPWVYVALAAHFLLFYPFATTLQLTQVTMWIVFALALAVALLQRGRLTGAGVALGIAVSIKPHLVVVPLLLFMLSRFPRRVPIVALGVVAVAAVISILWAGWRDSWAYATETLPTLSASYAYFPNQAMNGLLLRLFKAHKYDPAVYDLANPHNWVKVVGTLFGLALLAWALWTLHVGRKHRPHTFSADALALAFLAGAGTVASPVCWDHHLAALCAGYAMAVNLLLARPELRARWLLWILFASILLVGYFYDARHLRGFPEALLSALPLYGALALLGGMAWLARRVSIPAESKSGEHKRLPAPPLQSPAPDHSTPVPDEDTALIARKFQNPGGPPPF